jgi:hypothetical protein
MSLAILYDLCANSGAKLNFDKIMAIFRSTQLYSCNRAQVLQNTPMYETPEKRMGDTAMGVVACPFPPQDAKGDV